VAVAEEVRTVLMRNVVEKTGYPEDMLELDLDLEADLGIDTVKQVDIFTRTREYFGVPRDQNMTLRDFNTLRKVINHIVSRAQQLAALAPAMPLAPAAPAVVAAAVAPAPVVAASPSHPGNGAPRSVREALLSMDLSRLGVSPAEVHRLGEALSSRLALPPAELGGVKTLGELVRRLGKG
jgi:acyl carrier protein